MSAMMPAEWAPHEKLWIGFPSFWGHWEHPFAEAQRQIAAFADAVSDGGRGEEVHLIAGNSEAAMMASEMVSRDVIVEQRQIGDIWLRDTGCIVTLDGNDRIAKNFGFNGWGNRFNFDGDQTIGSELAGAAGIPITECDWVLEGGSIDVDGTGLAVTTADCLLNANRNAALSKSDIETNLRRDLSIDRVLWLRNGLHNDHTDGHVDNLARFVGPGHLAIPAATTPDDPNQQVYADALHSAEEFGCRVTTIPSVGKFEQGGFVVPASYMNFYIANSVVVVPIYGVPNDDAALAAFEPLFPGRRIIGLYADAVLSGGGSFHCSSQQVPLPPPI
jgi:agmatine deiminase